MSHHPDLFAYLFTAFENYRPVTDNDNSQQQQSSLAASNKRSFCLNPRRSGYKAMSGSVVQVAICFATSQVRKRP